LPFGNEAETIKREEKHRNAETAEGIHINIKVIHIK